MAEDYQITNIVAALAKQQFPTITVWNRLEGRPRRRDFGRAMKAEVRDALWMLTKQWQMGEFRGEDGGSPVFAKVRLATTRLGTYKAAKGEVEPFDDTLPLETRVERRPVPLTVQGRPASLDIRLLAGRQWLRMLSAIADYGIAFVQRYSIQPPDPSQPGDSHLCAHPEVWQTFAAVAGRRMDGVALYTYLTGGSGRHAYDGISTILEGHKGPIDTVAASFVRWFDGLFSQPPESGEDAWVPDRLEYQFACAAPEPRGEKVLEAEEYYHGRLDWYNLDVASDRSTLGKLKRPLPDPRKDDIQSLIPVPVTYDGMPNTRWWAFEDRRVNFGEVRPDTTDLGKLLFLEFGLVYANDWFLIPVVLPAGSISRVRGLAVTDVFGDRYWVPAAGAGVDDAWQRWSLFTLSVKGNDFRQAVDTSMLLLPTVPKIQEGKPLEEVVLLRDEVANMVWAVERTIPLATGEGKSGSEAAAETFAYFDRLLAERLDLNPAARAGIPSKAPVRYQVMNSVPEHWIPFISVRVPGDNRETQLQRAGMPRILPGNPDEPEKVRPRTSLMREGLDSGDVTSYFLHEEEVPRAGAIVRSAYQRTRWRNGKVLVWLGARKTAGRGGGSSGLAFDRLVPVPPDAQA